MSTLAHVPSSSIDSIAALADQGGSIWLKHFAKPERTAMLKEDLQAGRSVSAVLVSIVTLGLVLILTTLVVLLV